MTARTRKKATDTEDHGPTLVDLTHPDGERHYEASTPKELYNLVSGHGYSITEDGLSLEDAADRLAGNVTGQDTATAGDGGAPAAGTTPSTTTPTTTTSGTTA